jgi:methionyl-tRNA formyltransferase
MKYVFFGTPQFAAVILERLIQAGIVPSLVVTNPDRPAGRKGILTPPPVKVLAQAQGIPVAQPEALADFKFQISNFKFSFAVLAAYGKIIPKEIIEAFPKGIVVVHPSLLPRYRGATPIQSAILNGDKTTGTTLILMDEKVDHGAIVASRQYEVASSETYATLHDKLAEISADLLIETLPRYLDGEIKPVPQNEAFATYTKKFSADDAFVSEADLEKAQKEGGEIAVSTYRKIRALNPEPGVFTITKDPSGGKPQRIKLLEAKIMNGKLKLTKIQKEGGRPVVIGK